MPATREETAGLSRCRCVPPIHSLVYTAPPTHYDATLRLQVLVLSVDAFYVECQRVCDLTLPVVLSLAEGTGTMEYLSSPYALCCGFCAVAAFGGLSSYPLPVMPHLVSTHRSPVLDAQAYFSPMLAALLVVLYFSTSLKCSITPKE